MSESVRRQVLVEKETAGSRLDLFLSQQDEIPSRSFAQELIAEGLVSVSGAASTKHYRVKEGQVVSFEIPPPEEAKPKPEAIPLVILYEDRDLIVVSKPSGMVVHPSRGHSKGTLVNALLAHTKDLSGIRGVLRPGILHRLDKDVSGLMIVAKNDAAHIELSRQLEERVLKRTYLALVHGVPEVARGTIDAPLGRSPSNRKKIAVVEGGRASVTHFEVRERLGPFALLEVDLETGRTHQIRVHLSFIAHPLVGDSVYGCRREKEEIGLARPFLHAIRVRFNHPTTGEDHSVEEALPSELQKVLESLRLAKKD